MQCNDMITVYSEISTKHTDAPRGQSMEFLNVKLGGVWEG